ncbi:MAG: TetR/AcrR family transcriptional regulator [Treponema sp.]|uniref:TetR/AcrR family transcriptional regulator n=1 Tax=Treponema sp. TaxID=166 RepID=UPI00298E0E2D|nr:TetR/AcrR family transcriptional regulator [Treponema sp.]MCQ2602107.1 TetR/AcrR family transcriptional regulator [Treponema sp.]
MNNKENMLAVALDLFSKKGSTAVSVRDICGALNLKESALYYHFKNKQDLLDALYQQILDLIETMRTKFDNAFAVATQVSTQEMVMVSCGFLKDYLCNPIVSKFISMLSIERLTDSKANEVYNKLIYKMPLEQCEKVFFQMEERSFVKKSAGQNYAQIYYAIILNAYNQNVYGQCENPEAIEKALLQVSTQIEEFYSLIKM